MDMKVKTVARKPMPEFEYKQFRQKMKEIEKTARRHQAQAVSAAKEAMQTR